MADEPVTALPHLACQGTRSWPSGRSIDAERGAMVQVTRAHLLRNRELAVNAMGDGARAVLTDVVVADTLPRACATTTCPDFGGGIGIGAYLGGSIEATRFLVTRSAAVGVQVAREGAMDLREGVVSDNPVGANVQVPGFDVMRLTEGVVYRDNGSNLDTAELPVPDLSTSM